jgi:hypothetical protein
MIVANRDEFTAEEWAELTRILGDNVSAASTYDAETAVIADLESAMQKGVCASCGKQYPEEWPVPPENMLASWYVVEAGFELKTVVRYPLCEDCYYKLYQPNELNTTAEPADSPAQQNPDLACTARQAPG